MTDEQRAIVDLISLDLCMAAPHARRERLRGYLQLYVEHVLRDRPDALDDEVLTHTEHLTRAVVARVLDIESTTGTA